MYFLLRVFFAKYFVLRVRIPYCIDKGLHLLYIIVIIFLN